MNLKLGRLRLKLRKPELVFCVGAPRSGTTLLNSLLCEGKESYPMLPECTVVSQLVQHFESIRKRSDQSRFDAYFGSEEALTRIYRNCIEAIISNAISRLPDHRKYLVLKDPELTLLLDCLPDLFGSKIKVVYIIRDPRDVIASMLVVHSKAGRDIQFDEVVSNIFNYYYVASNSAISQRTESFHVVKYERLVSLDPQVFVRLRDFLGFEIGEGGYGRVAFSFDRSDPTYSEHFGRPITQEPIGKHSSMLSPDQTQKIQYVFSGYNETYAWW